jgi:hypothetical protein
MRRLTFSNSNSIVCSKAVSRQLMIGATVSIHTMYMLSLTVKRYVFVYKSSSLYLYL